MKKILGLTAFVLAFVWLPSAAQVVWKPGYVINHLNDTIRGFVKELDSKSYSNKCVFRVDENSEPQIFEPADIVGFRFNDGRFFVSKYVAENGANVLTFLEFLLQGKANIYHLQNNGERYFIEKNGALHELLNTERKIQKDGVSYVRENKEYIGVLNILMSDANISQDIFNTHFDINSIVRIAKKYHETICTDEQCVVYERVKNKTAITVGLLGGVTVSKMEMGDVLKTNRLVMPRFGTSVKVQNFFDFAENLEFELGLMLQHCSRMHLYLQPGYYKAGIGYQGNEYVIEHEPEYVYVKKSMSVDLNADELSIPFTINYRFHHKYVDSYLGAGIVYSRTLDYSNGFSYRAYGVDTQVFNFDKPLSVVLKAGIDYPLFKTHPVSFELAYTHIPDNGTPKSLNQKSHPLTLSVGYWF